MVGVKIEFRIGVRVRVCEVERAGDRYPQVEMEIWQGVDVGAVGGDRAEEGRHLAHQA